MNAATRNARGVALAALLLLLLPLAGACASSGASNALKRAEAHGRLGEWDSAIAYFQQVLQEDPGNVEVRRKLQYAKVNAALFHSSEGHKLMQAGDLQRAQLELSLAARYDPANARAVDDLTTVNRMIEEQRAAEDAAMTPIESAIAAVGAMEAPVPKLEHVAVGTMSFDYRRARLKEIYRAMARLGGINVIFDPELDNPQTSFYLADVTYELALDILTSTNGHFFRVMTPNTILVAEDTQPKRRQYEPQLMRTFFLSNADAEAVANSLQTILQARQVVANPAVNAVTIRDSAQVVDVAARMVSSLDKARGEVMLQVEIFEVDRTTMDKWGMSLSDYSTSVSIAQQSAEGLPQGISLANLANLTNADVFVTVPSMTYQFLKQDGTFRLLAQPQLRASDGQVSALLVGEQRPVVATTFNPATTVGGNVVPISSTEYRDVGIMIETTPRVHHDGMITLQLNLQITAVQEGAGAENQPVFTARTLTTTLRLREGETNLLAGLLRDDERVTKKGLPIISEIPVLRDLFGATEREVLQTDIVLSITPYVVRMADITEQDLAPIYVGTEASLGGGGAGGRRGSSRGGDDEDDDGGGGGGRGEEAGEPLIVSITPQSQSAAVGSEVTVAIEVDGDAEINNAGMRVAYDARVLRFVEAREGNLLSSDGNETSFQTSAAAAGSVAVGIGRVGSGEGVYAGGTLFELVFEAVAEGDATIQVTTAAIRDADGRPLPVQFERADVRVQ